MGIKLPRILSPNLGCPIIIAPQDLLQHGIEVVIAEPLDAAGGYYSLVAKPSFQGDGHKFELVLDARHELADPGLPQVFDRVEQTRWQISTTLRASIFEGKARFVRFSARPAKEVAERHLRLVSGKPGITLYDLSLRQNGEELFTVFHALALRPAGGKLCFIHATDLHVSLRNDLYEATLRIGEEEGGTSSPGTFTNFNKNLRRFIQHANDLADQGKLDFVLLLGDLVDFLGHSYSDRDDYGENNWRLLCDILTGAEARGAHVARTPGIKVPVFTSTGNHDWRFFPYPPKVNAAAFGLEKPAAKPLDPFWADDPEELADNTKKFYQKMIGEGALLSNVMLGGSYINKLGNLLPKLRDTLRKLLPRTKVRGNPLDWLLPRMATWQVQVLVPLIASGAVAGSATSWTSRSPVELVTMAFAAVSGLMNAVIGGVKFLVRWKSPELMALEAGWQGLKDYFLNLNPYFNYAFQVERNYFLILDTGFDCLRAQRFWDGGRKKLGRVSIRDNLMGGSPDSMGFFDANEFYPYSQIAWMEGLLRLISKVEGETGGPAQIFVGLHAPPINLSESQRRKADRALQDQPEVLLEVGKYDIRFGSINHYLSQFLHLCLGRAEGRPQDRFRPVCMVFAGHAHWKIECCLRWEDNGLSVYYGDYTGVPGTMPGSPKEPQPLLLQTPAIGPMGSDRFSQTPPHFRWLEVNTKGIIRDAKVTNA